MLRDYLVATNGCLKNSPSCQLVQQTTKVCFFSLRPPRTLSVLLANIFRLKAKQRAHGHYSGADKYPGIQSGFNASDFFSQSGNKTKPSLCMFIFQIFSVLS